MRTIRFEDIGSRLQALLQEEHPVDDDIAILQHGDTVLGVIVTPEAYEFLLQKTEEEEDRIDQDTVENFHRHKE